MRKDVGRALDQRGGERLAAEAADVDPAFPANLDRVHARRLPAHGVHARGIDLDVLAISPRRRRKSPSAMGLRQMLPVQTKRTCFTISKGGGGDAFAKVKSISVKSTRSA